MVYICDRTYSADDVRGMETEILRTLEYVLGLPTAYTFAVRYLSVAGAKPVGSLAACVTGYVLERVMTECALAEFAPSLVAAAAVDVALRTVEGPARGWCAALEAASGYAAAALRPAVAAVELVAVHQRVLMASLKAVTRKYASSRFLAAATVPLHASTPPPPPLPPSPQSAAAAAAAAAASAAAAAAAATATATASASATAATPASAAAASQPPLTGQQLTLAPAFFAISPTDVPAPAPAPGAAAAAAAGRRAGATLPQQQQRRQAASTAAAAAAAACAPAPAPAASVTMR
jgi:hypothetical protein